MRFALFAAGLLLTLSACGTPEPDGEDASAASGQDSSAVTSSVPDTLTMEAGGTVAQRPAAPLRIKGACPFECCTYGTWTTTGPTPVYRRAGDTTAVAFTVPAGTQLEARTGHVLLTQIGVAVTQDSARIYDSSAEYRVVPPGDTLLVLDYVAEGAYHVWYADSTYQAGPAAPAFEWIRKPASQWWVQVEMADGRHGWLWMERTPPVEGADACGA